MPTESEVCFLSNKAFTRRLVRAKSLFAWESMRLLVGKLRFNLLPECQLGTISFHNNEFMITYMFLIGKLK